MDKWDSEKIYLKNSEEFQYLDEIKELEKITKDIDTIVGNWYFVEHYNIQCNNVKDKLNTNIIKEKLLSLKNELESL